MDEGVILNKTLTKNILYVIIKFFVVDLNFSEWYIILCENECQILGRVEYENCEWRRHASVKDSRD